MKKCISILLIISVCIAFTSCYPAVSNTRNTAVGENDHVVDLKPTAGNDQASSETTPNPVNKYTASDYVKGFINASLPVDNVIVYNEETDWNELLGRPHQYTSKVNFGDTRLEQYDPEDPQGGTVEVFINNDDLQVRKSDLESVSDLYQHIFVSSDGLALLRISFSLTSDKAEEYVNVLNNIEDYINLPAPSPTVQEPSVPGFLDDKNNYALLRKAVYYYEFSELVNAAADFIAVNNPPADDVVYQIKELAEQGAKAMKNCKRSYDSFEETYTAYFKGYDSITKKVCIYGTLCGGLSDYYIGFRRSDWLNFTSCKVKNSNGDTVLYELHNESGVERDTLSGGIREYAEADLNDKEKQAILNSDSLTMRFSDKKDINHYDHKLSSGELKALKSIITLDTVITKLLALK